MSASTVSRESEDPAACTDEGAVQKLPSHLRRHLVAGVEPGGAVRERLSEDPRRPPRGSGWRSSPLPRSRSGRACRAPGRRPSHCTSSALNRSRKSTISCRLSNATASSPAISVSAVSISGNGEIVVVDACFRALREEGRDERRLVHEAIRRLVEHRERRVTERKGGGVLRPTEDVALREHDVPEHLPGGDHRGIVEGDPVRGPFLVRVHAGGLEHDLRASPSPAGARCRTRSRRTTALPSATIWSDRAISSSHVVGTSYPAASKSSFAYQTMLL